MPEVGVEGRAIFSPKDPLLSSMAARLFRGSTHLRVERSRRPRECECVRSCAREGRGAGAGQAPFLRGEIWELS